MVSLRTPPPEKTYVLRNDSVAILTQDKFERCWLVPLPFAMASNPWLAGVNVSKCPVCGVRLLNGSCIDHGPPGAEEVEDWSEDPNAPCLLRPKSRVMEDVISHACAGNYRDRLQADIDANKLSRGGAAAAANKIASLRRRNATLLGWQRDADTKKIDALETALQQLGGIITEATEAVCEKVSIVAESVAIMHTDLRSLMRGDVVLDDTTSLQEQRARDRHCRAAWWASAPGRAACR
jgi:hypothetical protein